MAVALDWNMGLTMYLGPLARSWVWDLVIGVRERLRTEQGGIEGRAMERYLE